MLAGIPRFPHHHGIIQLRHGRCRDGRMSPLQSKEDPQSIVSSVKPLNVGFWPRSCIGLLVERDGTGGMVGGVDDVIVRQLRVLPVK